MTQFLICESVIAVANATSYGKACTLKSRLKFHKTEMHGYQDISGQVDQVVNSVDLLIV